LLAVLGSFLYPVVVEPLFNRFTPMPESALRTQILRLAEREQVQVDDVLVADASRRTTTLNAYVSGLGSTRRVVVYDTLLQQAPPDEVESVVAHELAHAKNHDVLIGTVLGAVGLVGGTALLALLLDSRRLRSRADVAGPADPSVVALVLALVAVGSFLTSPAVNGVSRAIEARADRGALAATHDPAAFIRMQHRLAIEALSDPTPPRLSQLWFGSHPTALQRAGLPASLGEAGR
jgi:STE24 endopeptidase